VWSLMEGQAHEVAENKAQMKALFALLDESQLKEASNIGPHTQSEIAHFMKKLHEPDDEAEDKASPLPRSPLLLWCVREWSLMGTCRTPSSPLIPWPIDTATCSTAHSADHKRSTPSLPEATQQSLSSLRLRSRSSSLARPLVGWSVGLTRSIPPFLLSLTGQ